MNYLSLSTALVATLLCFGDAKAGCDNWFDGSKRCEGGTFSAEYWGCRSVMGTAFLICSGLGLPQATDAQLTAAKEKCQPGKDRQECEEALRDIRGDVQSIESLNFRDIAEKVKSQLDQEIENQAATLTARP